MTKRGLITGALALFMFMTSAAAQERAAQDKAAPCPDARDTACMLRLLDDTAAAIPEESWRDQTLREMAKLLAADGRYDDALAVLPRITNPDTRAMTNRGIGMEAANNDEDQNTYDALFAKLAGAAAQIDHPPSLAIAQTYIAMAQAFAGDDDGATATALAMENSALRNKALGESAEIQAERGDLPAAMASIAHIDDAAFRDKAHGLVAKILTRRDQPDEALSAAQAIVNDYQRAQAILNILARQITPEEITVE